ncbi:hypothetical protein KAJ27_01275 [bacterium]|nr:hypothetical protein [bacterium]
MKKIIIVIFLFILISPLFALFCPRCNSSNDNNNNFCRNCGLPLIQIREIVEKFKSSYDPKIPDSKNNDIKNDIPVLVKNNFPDEEKIQDPILEKLNTKFNKNNGLDTNIIQEIPVHTRNIPSRDDSSQKNLLIKKHKKNELISEIDSIFNRKEGPVSGVHMSRKSIKKKNTNPVTREKADISEKPASNKGGIIEIILKYSGGEKDTLSKYGKVYFNDKYVGNIYRYAKVKKNPYSHLLSKKSNYSMNSRLSSEITYKFRKDSISAGKYSVKIVLRRKLLFGSKDFPKKWKAVQVDDGVVSKLLYEWGGLNEFGE